VITVGSVPREVAASRFSFLGLRFRGRRSAIRELTHRDPDFVFWIHPDGRLHDARDSHMRNPPRGFAHIVDDEPDYGGFLRGRVATDGDHQLVVVYCGEAALVASGAPVTQLVTGLAQLPVPLDDGALVISDNGDLYGTVADLVVRAGKASL
jgi:hypothetical protein